MGGGSLNLEILRRGGAHAVSQFKVEGGGGEKNVPSITGVWIFSGITQSRHTFIFSHRFSLPITVYFSVGEKRRPQTDLHLQATRACFLLETIS